jgi:hypothetical protein
MKNFGVMVHNHLENNREITTKTGLIRSLRLFYSTCEAALQCSYQVHDSIATSFIITANYEDVEYQLFLNRFNEIGTMHSNKERTPAKHCEKNMWLIKPAALNQGQGIEVCRTLKEIQKSFRSKPINSLWIIQKYIEKPLLFKSRKFDIRMWAVATGRHELFYYRHGYLRTSSSEYDPHGTDNYIHLTNNCLQKYGTNYGAYEKGNTLSFMAFQEYLDSQFSHYGLNFTRDFIPRCKDLMIDSYLSAKKTIHKGKRKTVFEFLGFDFLIDEDFRVWLIEVNTNPYLGVPNEYIDDLLPKMLDDMLEITLDHFLPPKNQKERNENDFELLYAEHGSAFCKEGINQRQSYSTPVYPVSELAQVPLARQTVQNRNEDEPIKPPVRDLLSTTRHLLDNFANDVFEFTEIAARIVSQVLNWELLSEEQVSQCVQALKLLSGSPACVTLGEPSHVSSLLKLITSESVPLSLQTSVVESVCQCCESMKFRKEMVKKGMISVLVSIMTNTSSLDSSKLKENCLKLLLSLCTNPTKGVYIPGKSREHGLIKEKLISEGGVLALVKLARFNGSQNEEIEKVLAQELTLKDWDSLINLLKKATEGNFSFPGFSSQTLEEIRNNLEEISQTRREEIKVRKEKEKAKREEKEEENKKKADELKQIIEEKKLKAEEYINKRYEEIRKEKVNEMKKNNKLCRTIEDKLIEEKRHALLIKLKKAEELKLLQEFKIKQQEQEIKKNEVMKRKKLQEKKKLFMQEFSKIKFELERTKRGKYSDDREKTELDKLFNKVYYSKRPPEKLDTEDGSFFSMPDAVFAKNESTKIIDTTIITNMDKKGSARRYSPLISRQNLFKIYGRAFSNIRIGKYKKN